MRLYTLALGSACMNMPCEGAKVIATLSLSCTPFAPPICNTAGCAYHKYQLCMLEKQNVAMQMTYSLQ